MNSSVAKGNLSARALLRWQFRLAHNLLEAAIEQSPPENIQRHPACTGALAGACYAQAVLCEDLSVNGVLATGTPLALSTWSGRTGVSQMPSLAELPHWRDWAQRVQLDLTRLRSYANAVYASTDEYLDTLPGDAVHRPRGENRAYILNALLLTLSMRRGEILCLQGLESKPYFHSDVLTKGGLCRTGGAT
jgi:hypothetical protein